MGNGVSPPSVSLVESGLEGFHDASAADGPQALADHVENGTREGHLPRQEQTEGDGGIDVSSCTHSYKSMPVSKCNTVMSKNYLQLL